MIRLSSAAIAVVVLVSFFDNFSQFPVIAPYARSLGAAPAIIGIAVAIYSATNLFGNVVAGYFMDRLGRKKPLIIGLLAAGGAVLMYGAAQTPLQLVVVRAVHGLAAAILAPAAFTILGDLFPKEQRGRAMGANGALIALAAMVAPAVSGVMRDRLGFQAVFVAVALLMLAAALVAQLLVPETHKPEARERPEGGVIRAILGRRALAVAYAAAVALTFGLGTIVTYLPLYLDDLGYGGAQTGAAFSAFALVALLIMVSPASRSASMVGRVAPMGIGLVFVGIGLLLMGIWPTLLAVLGFMALFGLGFGLIFPAANALVADATLPGERGTAFGIFYAFYSMGVVLGATTSGFVATQVWIPVFGPFAIAGLLALLGSLWILSTRRI